MGGSAERCNVTVERSSTLVSLHATWRLSLTYDHHPPPRRVVRFSERVTSGGEENDLVGLGFCDQKRAKAGLSDWSLLPKSSHVSHVRVMSAHFSPADARCDDSISFSSLSLYTDLTDMTFTNTVPHTAIEVKNEITLHHFTGLGWAIVTSSCQPQSVVRQRWCRWNHHKCERHFTFYVG
jgi:hypothetical protein